MHWKLVILGLRSMPALNDSLMDLLLLRHNGQSSSNDIPAMTCMIWPTATGSLSLFFNYLWFSSQFISDSGVSGVRGFAWCVVPRWCRAQVPCKELWQHTGEIISNFLTEAALQGHTIFRTHYILLRNSLHIPIYITHKLYLLTNITFLKLSDSVTFSLDHHRPLLRISDSHKDCWKRLTGTDASMMHLWSKRLLSQSSRPRQGYCEQTYQLWCGYTCETQTVSLTTPITSHINGF